jgi:hypothetical protein
MTEWPYNRSNYVANRSKWVEHYMHLCNEEIKDRKKSLFQKMFKKWI